MRTTQKTPQADHVIAELWAVRDEHAARLGHDVEAIFRDIRAMQEASGREYLRYPARRVHIYTEDGESPPR